MVLNSWRKAGAEGSIVEDGSFESLMGREGVFRDCFVMQGAYYKERR